MTKRVAFLGLGVMGYPMAGHLSQSGYQVTVYNRTPAKAERWLQAFSGTLAATPKAAAREADLVFACVGNDDDIREITTGPGGAWRRQPFLLDSARLRDHSPYRFEV